MFDSQVRSALGGAEVRPPRRAWRAVSRSLGRQSGGVRYPAWAFAAAACTAAAIVWIVGRTHGPAEVHTVGRPGVIAVVSSVPVAGDLLAVKRAEPLRPDGRRSLTEASRAGAPAVADIVPQALADGVSPVQPDTAAAAVQDGPAAVAGTHVPDGGSNADAAQGAADPFTWPDSTEPGRRPARRNMVTVSGLIGSNDNTSSSIVSRKMSASGNGHSAKTISQSGESSYSIPVSLAIGLRRYVSKRWSFGTGVQYSMLRRTFDGTYIRRDDNGAVVEQINAKISNTQQYIGIPVTAYYDIISNDDMSVYAFGAGVFERAVGNRYRVSGAPDVLVKGEKRGLQTSAALGFGVSFNVSSHLGIYLDPSFNYYFDCNQPVSIRTQQPFQFTFTAGLRFML